MIPQRPKEPLAQRLFRDMAAQLAKHVGCCPVHGTPIICCLCDITWTGSVGEEMELEALVARTALDDLTWPSWPCGRCGAQESALCPDCYEPVREMALAGLTPAEEVRCGELLTKVRLTGLPDPDGADAPTGAHETGETP
jgi:hypothetical protein